MLRRTWVDARGTAWNRGRVDRERVVEQVRAVEAAYDTAETRGNAPGVLACLTEDVTVVDPRGEVARGRAEVEGMLSAFLGGAARGTSHRSEVVRVELVTADVALVDGVATIGGAGEAPYLHSYTDVLRRDEGGSWRIAHVRACASRGWGDGAGSNDGGSSAPASLG